MKVVKKIYFEFQTLFFVCIVFVWVWSGSASTRLIEDHEIPEMNVVIYNTTDGRQCTLGGTYVPTNEYYVFERECESYDRTRMDNVFIAFVLTFAANGAVSKRRVVEEMIDEETGEIRSVLSSKRVYEVREYVGNEIVEIYIGSYRLL